MEAQTYNLSTDTGKVRLLATDTTAPFVFDDGEIAAFLDLESSNIRRAAALALETMASNEAYVLKRITSLDLQTDGPAVSAELRQRAADLRKQAADAEARDTDGVGAFDVAEMVTNDFTRRERLWNQRLRGVL